jgi:hypothetical protein
MFTYYELGTNLLVNIYNYYFSDQVRKFIRCEDLLANSFAMFLNLSKHSSVNITHFPKKKKILSKSFFRHISPAYGTIIVAKQGIRLKSESDCMPVETNSPFSN